MQNQLLNHNSKPKRRSYRISSVVFQRPTEELQKKYRWNTEELPYRLRRETFLIGSESGWNQVCLGRDNKAKTRVLTAIVDKL